MKLVVDLLRRIPLVCWLAAMLLTMSVTLLVQSHTSKVALHNLTLEKDSVEASLMVTKILHANNTDYYTRRAVQTDLKIDALNKQIKTVSMARATLQFMVDSIYGSADHVDVDGLDGDTLPDVLNVNFSGYTAPFTVAGVTIIDLVEDTAGVKYSVVMDPFKIGARIECGKTAVNGVRPASLFVDVPKFMRVSIDTLRYSPDVCSPLPPPVFKIASKKTGLLWFLGGVATTYAAHQFLSKE